MKKHMKFCVALTLSVCLALGLSGCGKQEGWSAKTASEVTITTLSGGSSATNTDSPIETPEQDSVYAQAVTEDAQAKEEQERFHEYLWEAFEESVLSDSITLHYTVADPESYGLTRPETATYGDSTYTLESIEKDKKELQDERKKLDSFDYDKLTGEQKYTYDILSDYVDMNLESYDYVYLYEPFAYTSGLQSNMPINLSEYKFYCEQDVKDYLTLLENMPEFFDRYLNFEKQKSAKGLFMNAHCAEEVIRQCTEFIEKPEENLLIATFEDKVRGVSGLSEEDISSYCTQNHDLVIDKVIPTYKRVQQTFQLLKASSKNELGLAHLENGKEYYAYLLRDKVGTDKTPEEVIACLDSRINQVLKELQTTATTHMMSYNKYFEDIDDIYKDIDPLTTIQNFEEMFADSFPAMPDVEFKVEDVHPSLQDIVSPAFYVTTPIDAYTKNSIYLNLNSDGAGSIWSTLAHEGIPGHMYQFTYYLNTNPEPIRCLLNFNGYTEGWATYVEMMSFDKYTDYEDEMYADFERLNSQLNLLVSARVEIGVNYEGWTLEETKEYLTNQGFNGEAAEELFDYVIAEPVNYQMYVMGWISFVELREYAEQQLGEQFNEKEYHQVLLDCGPSPFYLLRTRVQDYVRSKK